MLQLFFKVLAPCFTLASDISISFRGFNYKTLIFYLQETRTIVCLISTFPKWGIMYYFALPQLMSEDYLFLW